MANTNSTALRRQSKAEAAREQRDAALRELLCALPSDFPLDEDGRELSEPPSVRQRLAAYGVTDEDIDEGEYAQGLSEYQQRQLLVRLESQALRATAHGRKRATGRQSSQKVISARDRKMRAVDLLLQKGVPARPWTLSVVQRTLSLLTKAFGYPPGGLDWTRDCLAAAAGKNKT